MKLQWSYVVYLMFFMGAAGVATQVYKIGGSSANTLFFWLAAIGITSTTFWMVLQEKFANRKKQVQDVVSGGGAAAAPAAAGAADGEVDGMVKEAESKLAASRVGQGVKLPQMPVIFLVGDQGSTKTTVLMNSGMEPELLSGQVYQGDNMIAPTRSANFWFAKKAVFVETGGPLWLDGGGWTKLLKKLSPPKLKGLFGGGGPSAPRAALLCLDIERFLQPGASDTMAGVARGVQTRLNEISTQFGISFPVYVLFTKIDRVTFFHDFVRNLSTEESTQVFGVTLPMRPMSGGVYGEQETQRLNQMYNELFHSLCDKRIEFLPRENDTEKQPGCYEFPREFRKLQNNLIRFLVDVGRPSALTTSPFLRGFYFTGVRPVIVNDVAPTPLMNPRSAVEHGGGSATRMFKFGEIQPQVPMAAPQQSGGRKVPQWVFLSHLFNDVILEDKAAMGASGASTKTSGMRRVLLGLLGALAFLYIIAATISFFRNKGLESDAADATKQIKAVRLAAGAVPAVDDLKRLDSLRKQLEQLTDWKRDGAPYSYRWGLYVGNDMLPIVRKAYYDCFNQLLFSETQMKMVGFMRPLPPKANQEDDYSYAYNTLRAHLMTTSETKHVDTGTEEKFLNDTLMARWIEKREATVGEERRGLADAQFRFYAGDLKNGNPFGNRDDAEGVERARIYLASFSGFDRLYNAMLAAADKKNPSVNFNKKYPGSSQVVINNKDVRGAFTHDGWAFMQNAFKNRNKDFGGEEWVLPGRYKSQASVPENIDQMLHDRYASDYIKTWREYYGITRIVAYSSLQDAAAKLQLHSGASAPVLALIGLGSYHTNVEPPTDPYADKVIKAFKWSHIVTPPSKDLAIVTGSNQAYKAGLSSLQIAADAASKVNPPGPSEAGAIQAQSSNALVSARQVMAFPGPDLEAKLDQTIARIMEEPTKIDISPAKMLNAAGGAFCNQFNLIQAKFPFKPDATQEVSLGELNDILKPPAGQVFMFYDKSLKQYLARPGPGSDYNPTGTSVNFNPSFLRFFNQLIRFSDAIYKGGGDPQLAYSMQFSRALQLIDNTVAKSGSISVDGKAASIGGPAVDYVWTGASHTTAVRVGDTPVSNKSGPWSIFRFFAEATVTPQTGGAYLIANPLKFNNDPFARTEIIVNLRGAPAVFDRNFMSGLRCIAQVATK